MIKIITYASGPSFSHSKKRIVEEAKKTGCFDTVEAFDRKIINKLLSEKKIQK